MFVTIPDPASPAGRRAARRASLFAYNLPPVRVFGLSLLLALAAAALPLGSRPAAQQTATVRGRVTIDIPPASRRPSSAYPSRAVAQAQLAPPSEVANVVVYLKDAPAGAVTPRRAAIRQRGETFLPRVVAVPIGSTVDFPNDDPIFHNVFSLSRARTFNLGRFPRGESRSVRFDKPGIVKVFCDIHSHMAATVVVFNHPWFTVPDADGAFELDNLPAGNQQITAWHERLGDTTLRVRTDVGRTSSVEFVLPVPAK
jgi:plastocyanin